MIYGVGESVVLSPFFFVRDRYRYRYRTRKRVFLSLLSILAYISFDISVLLCLMNILLARRNYYSREGKVFSSQG